MFRSGLKFSLFSFKTILISFRIVFRKFVANNIFDILSCSEFLTLTYISKILLQSKTMYIYENNTLRNEEIVFSHICAVATLYFYKL